MQGHRVNSKAALAEPGDYYVDLGPDGAPAALWARLPDSGTQARIPAVDHGIDAEPEWTITLNASGTVTVLPSIDGGGYHGHLTDGIWSEP
jgi:hypothetical protein